MKSQVGVWIDHRRAVLAIIEDGNKDTWMGAEEAARKADVAPGRLRATLERHRLDF